MVKFTRYELIKEMKGWKTSSSHSHDQGQAVC